MRLPALIPVALVVTLLAACSGPAPRPVTSTGTISQAPLAVSEQGNEAAGLKVQGSAADIARNGRPVERNLLRPGDLVFFNTLKRPFSHVGIYLGDQRFIHAPSSNGRVRIDRLNDRYYAQRFEAARTFFD